MLRGRLRRSQWGREFLQVPSWRLSRLLTACKDITFYSTEEVISVPGLILDWSLPPSFTSCSASPCTRELYAIGFIRLLSHWPASRPELSFMQRKRLRWATLMS